MASGSGDAAGAPPAAGDDSVLVGFLLVDMAVMGKVLPSKQAADALGGMIGQAAGTRGPEGPDQVPETQAPRDSTPFDATLPSGSHASGTMETKFSTKAERSLVSVKLDGSWSSTTRPGLVRPPRAAPPRSRSTTTRRSTSARMSGASSP